MKQKVSFSTYVFLGSMLFGLFFGGGNLIFPVHMGQEAGRNVWMASLGFIITSTGLPLLGVIAIGLSKQGNLLGLASLVGKKWAYFFTILLYLTIGPMFALPRTATVAYEVGLSLLVSAKYYRLGLAVFTVLFFGLAMFFSLYPSKLLLWVGKVLNPVFLVLLTVLIVASVLSPMGRVADMEVGKNYVQNPFFYGFIMGYNTMDALASLAFGIIVVDALKALKIEEPRDLVVSVAKAGTVSAMLMVIIYFFLAYMGSSSRGIFPVAENGGKSLAMITAHYFGSFGSIVLSLIVGFACIKTAIGLITACSDVFKEMLPFRRTYKNYVFLFTGFSLIVANVGLTHLINLSIPVLMFLYPPAIMTIVLALFTKKFGDSKYIWVSTISVSVVCSFGDALVVASDTMKKIAPVERLIAMYKLLPYFDIGMSWVIPSIVVMLVGIIVYKGARKREHM